MFPLIVLRETNVWDGPGMLRHFAEQQHLISMFHHFLQSG
jgi:hypothetical protein